MNSCATRAPRRPAFSRSICLLLLLLILTCRAAGPAPANDVNMAVGNGQVVTGTTSGTGIDTYTFPVPYPGNIFVSLGQIGTHVAASEINLYNTAGTHVAND